MKFDRNLSGPFPRGRRARGRAQDAKMAVEQFQRGNPDALRRWYEEGADGQIDWGTPGDFEQCVSIAGQHVSDPEGFCQERHIAATGEPAGRGAHGGQSATDPAGVTTLSTTQGEEPMTVTAETRRKPDDDTKPREAFRGVLVAEDEPTGDNRGVRSGALEWADPPLTLYFQGSTPPGGIGASPHAGAIAAGHIEAVYRDPENENVIRYAGFWDSGADGQEAARMVGEGTLKGISADISHCSVELDEDERQWITYGMIRAGTVCGIPAIMGASIENVGTEELSRELATVGLAIEPDEDDVRPPKRKRKKGDADADDERMGAHGLEGLAAAGGPPLPPEHWFQDPQLAEPTPLIVTDEGRIYGHIATWGTPHIGLAGAKPPHSATRYAHFLTGARRVGCDCEQAALEAEIPVGTITLSTGHADERGINPRQAVGHYDNTGLAVGDIATGEDEHGIWAAGATRPTLSDDRLIELRGSALSGDWRLIGGNLELVAVLAVNVPGFGIPRAKFHLEKTAAGDERVTALVAAGVVVPPEPTDRIEAALTEMSGEIAALHRKFDAPRELERQFKRLERLSPTEEVEMPDRPKTGFEAMVAEYDYVKRFRDFDTATRKKLAKSGAAMPDGSFPIENCGDVTNAVRAVGRGSKGPSDVAARKAHIIKRARATGCTDSLPDSWK